MTYLLVDIVTTPAATLVTISGEVDIATVAQFCECLDTVPNCNTVLEMSDVTLLSAVGLRVLLNLQDRLAAVGAWLVLAAPSHPVRRVLDVTGLDVRLPLESTVEDALILLGSVAREEQRTMSAAEQCRVPAAPAQDPAPAPVGRSDDEWSRDADQCPTSVVRDTVAVTHVVKFGLMQEQAVTARAGAAAVMQASAELKAHAAALRRRR